MSAKHNKSWMTGRKRTFKLRFRRVLIGAAVLLIVFVSASGVLKKIAIRQISELTNTEIKARKVSIGFNGSVVINELSIRPQKESEYDDTFLKAEKVHARFNLLSLMLLKPRLDEIKVRNFVFNAQHDIEANHWNTEDLKLQAPMGKMPLIRLSGGILQYSKVSRGQVKIAAAIPLDARFGLNEKTQKGYSFDIVTAERTGSAKSELSGFWQDGKISFDGAISSADVAAFESVWTVDEMAGELIWDEEKNYSLKLRVKDLLNRQKTNEKFAGGEFAEKPGLINILHKFFNDSKPAGKIDIELDASGNLGNINESRATGAIFCKDVSIYDRSFPYLIEHLAGRIDFSENQVLLNDLSGVHGDVRLLFSGHVKDFGANLQYDITMKSDNMVLDKDLYEALGKKHKKLWSMFSPSGLTAVNYNMTRKAESKAKEVLSVELLDVNAVCVYFPYPLENLAGKMIFSGGNVVISDLVSQAKGEGKLTFNGGVTGCGGDRPIYEIAVKAEDIPLDSTLGAALSARQRKLYKVFVLSGTADAQVRIFTPENMAVETSFAAEVDFKKSSFKMDPSELVITEADGKALFTPDSVDIVSMKGKQGEGCISLKGRARPGEGGDKEELMYRLILRGEEVKLGDDVFGLLPGPLEKVSSYLQPEGKINYTAELNKDVNESDYRITVECLGDRINCMAFPYPVKDVTGTMTITQDSIGLENISASPVNNFQVSNAGSIRLNGKIALAENGFGDGRFDLHAKDISFDKQLGAALPKGMESYYKYFSPAGRFDLDFDNIRIFSKGGKEKFVEFEGGAKLKDCRFNFTSATAAVTGAFKLKFLYELGKEMHWGQGQLLADSIKIKNVSLKNINAKADYSRKQRSWSAQNITGDFYGGKFTGQFSFKRPQDSAVEYMLQTNFDDVDLNKLLSEARPGDLAEDGHSSGKMQGLLNIGGQVGQEAIGRCKLEISDMKVGKMSPVGKLLAVLSLNEPKNFAFNEMLVNSYIKGNTLFFEKLDLAGDAMAFNGSGLMDLRTQNINLTLAARGPRIEPSILQSLADDLGRGVIQIEVSGNIYDPQIKKVPLPMFKDTLNILGTR